jgi:hypothetical protein
MKNSKESKKLIDRAFDFTKTGGPTCKMSATYHGHIAVLLVEITVLWLEFRLSLFLLYSQLCDFGFARAMSANTVVLRSIKGTFHLRLLAYFLTKSFPSCMLHY